MTTSDTDDQIARAEKLLAEHGFKLEICACGCCDSPWVRLEHNGETIIGEKRRGKMAHRQRVNIFMFRESE